MTTAEAVVEKEEIMVSNYECPICAKNPQFNAETIAALEEGLAMREGKIPTKWYESAEDMLKALKS